MKTRPRLDLKRYAPVELDLSNRKDFLVAVLLLASFFSVCFFALNYANTPAETLSEQVGSAVRVWSQAPAFHTLAAPPLVFFDLISILILVWQVPSNYAMHRKGGSKSIYLMRRLPDRWEYHRRCWGFALLSAAAVKLCQWGLALSYFLFYMLATPDVLIPPGSWRSLLEVLL